MLQMIYVYNKRISNFPYLFAFDFVREDPLQDGFWSNLHFKVHFILHSK